MSEIDPWADVELDPTFSLDRAAAAEDQARSAGSPQRYAQLRVVEARERAADDAAGAVRVAEARLAEAEGGPTSKRVAAEEALAKADRNLAAARAAVDDAQAILDHLDSASNDMDTAAAPPELVFHSLPEFVRDFLCPTFRRPVSGRGGSLHWDAEWWRSGEAVIRLEALWRSWENLRLDPATGASVWLRDHLDHHLRVLMSEEGPFADSRCTADRTEPLPHTDPPEGMFPKFPES